MATTDPDHPRDYPPPPASGGAGRTLSVVGFVLAAIALLVAPPLFGLAAVVLGIVAHRRGDPLGRWVIVAGIVGAIIGIALALVVLGGDGQPGALAVSTR